MKHKLNIRLSNLLSLVIENWKEHSIRTGIPFQTWYSDDVVDSFYFDANNINCDIYSDFLHDMYFYENFYNHIQKVIDSNNPDLPFSFVPHVVY